MLKTVKDIQVVPFLRKSLLSLLNKALPLKDGEEYVIDLMALYKDGENNLLVNRDCEYIFLEKTYFEKQIQYVYMIPVRIKTKTGENSYSISSNANFYIPLAEKYFESYTFIESIPLDKYMGSNLNYNRKVMLNTLNFLKLINEQ